MTVFIAKRVALVFFSYFILSCALYAQTSQVGTPSNVEPLPQVFTPNAAELGKYGKIPVSYANGQAILLTSCVDMHIIMS